MRNISADIFADEFFGSLSKVHRMLWLGLLLNIADDQGRMIDNVALIRSLIFPYDDDVTLKDIEKGLTIFVTKHKITRYTAGTNGSGKRLMQIVNWWKYQKSTQWAGRSQFQAPPKWNDRIRVHEKGGSIALVNWDHSGGYEVYTKPLRSRNKAATKRQQSREVNNEVNTVIVVVADAFKKYQEEISTLTPHAEEEIEKLFNVNPVSLAKAIAITAEQHKDKKSLAYLKATFKNLQQGTKKPEPRARHAATPQPKTDAGKYVKL